MSSINQEVRTGTKPGVRLSKTIYSPTDNSAKKSETQQKGSTLKFAAPVKAGVIENTGETYVKSVLYAAGLGITHLMIGATVMATYIYSASHGDPHVVFFTLAYHFFVAEAILTLTYINGWSTPMRWKHRKYTHMMFQICGIFCCFLGTVFIKGNTLFKCLHGISGVVSLLLTIGAGISGPFILKGVHNSNLYHMTFGIPCFFMSSVCAFSGLLHPHFRKWADFAVNCTLMFFIVFYTGFILVTTSIKLWRKMST